MLLLAIKLGFDPKWPVLESWERDRRAGNRMGFACATAAMPLSLCRQGTLAGRDPTRPVRRTVGHRPACRPQRPVQCTTCASARPLREGGASSPPREPWADEG